MGVVLHHLLGLLLLRLRLGWEFGGQGYECVFERFAVNVDLIDTSYMNCKRRDGKLRLFGIVGGEQGDVDGRRWSGELHNLFKCTTHACTRP
jgi:hypothetical protein